MGDRANVKVLYGYDHPPVYLYTHWGGHDLPATVHGALKRKERWDDPSYLARIVFDAMVGGDKGTTGHGIAPYLPDNEHPIIVLDSDNRKIFLETETGSMMTKPQSMEEFLEKPEALLSAFYSRGDTPDEGSRDLTREVLEEIGKS